MATKQAVNKSQAVRDYLGTHPGAVPSEIVTALNKQGIAITSGRVATIKMLINKNAAPPVVEMPADPLTLDQIKKDAQAIKRIRTRGAGR